MGMVLYRGSLKSCNYRCSYCPFSKHAMTERELAKDREQWLSFVRGYMEQTAREETHALMLTPYGEALIHPWYWEGLARISALPWVEAVGAQTNLGFPVAESLEIFAQNGGIPAKLRLWATFHPQMTTAKEFARTCRQLVSAGVQICAGAVGAPEHTGVLQKLAEQLPDEIYFWINKMDGLGRAYTAEEEQVFSDLDPYFYRELQPHPADVSQCRGRIFAEGDGRMRLCNISAGTEPGSRGMTSAGTEPGKGGMISAGTEPGSGGWIRTGTEPGSGGSLGAGSTADARSLLEKAAGTETALSCSRKRCSCYLAYGGRENLVNQMLFGPWPLFRIPRRPKAVFLDIEGTLLPDRPREKELYLKDRADSPGCGEVPADIQAALEVLVSREKTLLFFATTLPYADAKKRCRKVWHLFSGGVFAAGAHILSENTEHKEEFFYFLDPDIAGYLEPFRQRMHVRMLVYRNEEGRSYKVTLLHTRQRPWSAQEAEEVMDGLPEHVRAMTRYLLEEHCMQIVSARAGKAAGVRLLCEWLRIPLEEAFAAGNSAEDEEMVKLCSRRSIFTKNA